MLLNVVPASRSPSRYLNKEAHQGRYSGTNAGHPEALIQPPYLVRFVPKEIVDLIN